MKIPLLSVIIPAFNVEDYIVETMESVANQTYPHIEMIVVNDGSTDNTLIKIEAAAYTNTVIISKTNGGLSSARNAGLAVAKGQIITFLDGDDIIAPNTYEINIPLFSNKVIDVVQFPILFGWKGKDERVCGQMRQLFSSKKEIITEIIRQNISFSMCDKLYRRSFFDNHPFKEGIFFEDISFWSNTLIQRQISMQLSDKGMYFYRERVGSIIHSLVGFNKAYDYTTVTLQFCDIASQANVKTRFKVSYFAFVLETLNGFDLNRSLTPSQREKIDNMLRPYFPSNMSLFFLRICGQLGSRKKRIIEEMKKSIKRRL